MRLRHLFALALVLIFSTSTSVPALELLYVATASGNVLTYDILLTSSTAVQNSQLTFANTDISGPTSIIKDSLNNIYVANASGTYSGQVSVFNSAGSYQTNISSANPNGLAFDSSWNLYASNTTANNVNKFTGTSTPVTPIGSSSNLSSPTGITVDFVNNLWVANSGKLVRYDSAGQNPTDFTNANISSPGNITYHEGYIYVASTGNNRIEKLNTSTGVWTSIVTNNGVSIASPTGVAFDLVGNMYVSNNFDTGSSTYSISKFNSAGTGVFSWTLTEAPMALVPEPSTYVLSLVASGTFAFAARRRKARKPETCQEV